MESRAFLRSLGLQVSNTKRDPKLAVILLPGRSEPPDTRAKAGFAAMEGLDEEEEDMGDDVCGGGVMGEGLFNAAANEGEEDDMTSLDC